jgi:hypothetical protein
MGCDIHYSIERVSEQYYRKNKINTLISKDDNKLSFKEYCEEDKKENIKTWVSLYIKWVYYGNQYGFEEPDEDTDYITDSQHYENFLKLGYKNNKDLDLYIGRNYNLFAIIGDARNYGDKPYNSISAYREIPEDASEVTKYYCNEIWEGDGHSHSWISLKEILEFGKDEWYKNHCQGFWDKIVEYMISLNLPPEDVRLVFWFDN